MQVLNYSAYDWAFQGPTRLTSVLEIFCKNFDYLTKWPNGGSAKDVVECIPNNKTTEQFSVAILNSKYAYPIKHWNWEQLLLSEAKSKQVLHRLKEDKTFAVHLWHNGSKGRLENITSQHSPYAEIMSRHCPMTFKKCYSSDNTVSCNQM